MSCRHDWYDDYKAYTRMNAGRTNRGGGDDWGCLLMLLSPILFVPLMYVFIMTVAAIGSVIGSGIMSLFEFLIRWFFYRNIIPTYNKALLLTIE